MILLLLLFFSFFVIEIASSSLFLNNKVPNCRDESDEEESGCGLLVLKENYRK